MSTDTLDVRVVYPLDIWYCIKIRTMDWKGFLVNININGKSTGYTTTGSPISSLKKYSDILM